MGDKPYWLTERQFSAEKRRELARKGLAMKDGSFPIETKADLKNAIRLAGNAENPAAAKRHIIKRARALGAVSTLPDSWGVKEADVTRKTETTLPLANRDFRIELGRALLSDQAFAKDMSVAAAKALAGDPLQEAERSHNEQRELVSQALRDKFRTGDEDYGPWIRDMYDDRVIFEHQGDTFQVTYSIDDDENVTLGEKVEVEIRYVAKVTPAQESLEDIPVEDLVPLVERFTPLLEKAMRGDGTAAVKIIAPGQGSSGRYDPEVLERDGKEAFPSGTKMYWDHPTVTEDKERPERSLRDVAATTVSDPYYNENGPDGPGLYTDAKVVSTYRETVEELAPHMGVSIRALGVVNQDDNGEAVVEKIAPSPHNSIDFVTEPGAGGKVLELFESARGRGTPPAPRKEDPSMDLQEATRKLTEAERKLQEAQAEKDTAIQERDAARQEADRLKEGAVIRQAADHVLEALDTAQKETKTELPAKTRARIVERLSKNPPTDDKGELDKQALTTQVAEAAKDEIAYLNEVLGSGRVRGLGPSDGGPESTVEDLEKGITEALADIGVGSAPDSAE